MKGQAGNNTTPGWKVGRFLAMEKGKTAVAACLIGLMAFMWVRVFMKKHGANKAEAALTLETELPRAPSQNESKIRFIKLPEIKGRNDVLSRDFFATEGWANFTKDTDGKNSNQVEEVRIIAENDGNQSRRREGILRLARELKLQAIALGNRPVAFIGNTLVRAGGKLQVEDRGELYEFDVIKIDENEVVLRCEGISLEIKMLQESEVLKAK